MANWYRYLATSQDAPARLVRRLRRGVLDLSLPAPKAVAVPVRWGIDLLRGLWRYLFRLLVCEPYFKSHCSRHGRGVRTGVYLHFFQGRGRLVIGDRVTVDGKCSFLFGARFIDHPTLTIGDGTGIGHDCTFTVGRAITIGRDCRIAGGVWMFDSSGHPSDPAARRAGLPPAESQVREIRVGDNVWIGGRAIIYPGVTLGDGSVVSAGSVVTNDVPPMAIVAGNPARRIATFTKLEAAPAVLASAAEPT